jgi:hypothetical protein
MASTGVLMPKTVDKREIMPGMTLDVSNRHVFAPWPYGEPTGQPTLTVVRLERKYATHVVTKQQGLASTTVYAANGARVTYYHHFEGRVRLVSPVRV